MGILSDSLLRRNGGLKPSSFWRHVRDGAPFEWEDAVFWSGIFSQSTVAMGRVNEHNITCRIPVREASCRSMHVAPLLNVGRLVYTDLKLNFSRILRRHGLLAHLFAVVTNLPLPLLLNISQHTKLPLIAAILHPSGMVQYCHV